MPLFKAKSTDALASVARHLNYALQDSPDLEAAFKRLYATADERRRVAIGQLEDLLRSSKQDHAQLETTRSTPYPTLTWIVSQAPVPERSLAAVLQEYRRQESLSAAGAAVVWSEFAGFLTYLGAVLAVLIVLLTVYSTLILPQYRSLYVGFGRQLPGLTNFVFGSGGPVFTLLLVGSAVLLIFLVWFVRTLRRRMRRRVPVSGGYQRIPLVSAVALAYNQYLCISYASLLKTAGVPVPEALQLAARKVGAGEMEPQKAGEPGSGRQSPLGADLASASQLGKLDEELQYQQEATTEALLAALARCRRLSRVILTTCIYLLVAIYVSAMYLPIFSLGDTV